MSQNHTYLQIFGAMVLGSLRWFFIGMVVGLILSSIFVLLIDTLSPFLFALGIPIPVGVLIAIIHLLLE